MVIFFFCSSMKCHCVYVGYRYTVMCFDTSVLIDFGLCSFFFPTMNVRFICPFVQAFLLHKLLQAEFLGHRQWATLIIFRIAILSSQWLLNSSQKGLASWKETTLPSHLCQHCAFPSSGSLNSEKYIVSHTSLINRKGKRVSSVHGTLVCIILWIACPYLLLVNSHHLPILASSSSFLSNEIKTFKLFFLLGNLRLLMLLSNCSVQMAHFSLLIFIYSNSWIISLQN